MDCRVGIAWMLLLVAAACADEPVADERGPDERSAEERGGEAAEQQPPAFELNEEVREAVVPLFQAISEAEVSRATVEMLADSLVGGTVVESQKSTFQIASKRPDNYTIYLKEPEQRMRVYCNGESMTVAVAADAFFRLPDSLPMQDAVTSMPVPLGPYPEPVLALTLAGVDPAISLVAGMKSIEVVDRDDFRGKTPAIHLRGVQADAVTWDFWIAEKDHRPLRLLVDLSPMLLASDQVQVPANYSYQVRYDFLSWRVTGEVDDGLFTFKPPKDATEYESLADYYQSMSGVSEEHPLLGKPVPTFTAKTLAGEEISIEDLAGKVVVLDFWATWCKPCLQMIPILQEVTSEFEDKDVVFFALNTGEEKEKVTEFMNQQELDLNVLLDPEGTVADGFFTDAIPQTVVIGKQGAIESVHVGFLGEDALRQRLKDELEVLSIGGRIASATSEAEADTRE